MNTIIRKIGLIAILSSMILLTSSCEEDGPYADVELETTSNEKLNLGQYQGKRVLLNLWGTWCRPCVAEMPSLDKAYRELKDENYVFLAASDEKLENLQDFDELTDYELPLVQIAKGYAPFQVSAVPMTIVFDTKGNIALEKVGALNWHSKEILEELRAVK